MKIRKNYKILMASLMFVVGLIFVVRTAEVSAASAPTDVHQVSANVSTASAEWTAQPNTYYYMKYALTTTNLKTSDERAIGKGNSVMLSPLNAGSTYYMQIGIRPVKASGAVDITSPIIWSNPVEIVTKPKMVEKDSVKQTKASTTSISLKWDAVSGATKYMVEYWDSSLGTNTAKKAYTTTNSIKLTGLSKNKKYSGRVYAMRSNSTNTYTAMQEARSFSSMKVKPTKVTGFTVDYVSMSTKKSPYYLDYSIDKNAVADGYQYEVYNAKDKKIISGKTTGYTRVRIKSGSLKKNQFYKVRVRAYIGLPDNNMVYGTWSNPKYTAKIIDKLTIKTSGTKVKKISWSKVDGATGYIIYTAPRSSGKYKKIATVTKKNYYNYNKTIKKNQDVYIRVVPIKKMKDKDKTTYKSVINGKAVYSGYVWRASSGKLYKGSYN